MIQLQHHPLPNPKVLLQQIQIKLILAHPSSTADEAAKEIDKLKGTLPDNSPMWKNVKKDEFVADLTHLVNNPLSLNQGYTELCGIASPLTVVIQNDPKGIVDAMIGLYNTGTFNYNTGSDNLSLSPSTSIMNYVGGSKFAENAVTPADWNPTPSNNVEGMLLYTVADNFKGVSNILTGGFSEGKVNTRWEETDLNKALNILNSFGYSTETHGGNYKIGSTDKSDMIIKRCRKDHK